MSGYRVKQTVCIMVGLLIGLWAGNFTWHAVARRAAERVVKNFDGEKPGENTPEYKPFVEEVVKEIETRWSQYTFPNLWGYFLSYGIAGVLGVGAGTLVAAATGGEQDK